MSDENNNGMLELLFGILFVFFGATLLLLEPALFSVDLLPMVLGAFIILIGAILTVKGAIKVW